MKDRYLLRYEDHFASKRPDGRHTSTYAAQLARMRDIRPSLALPEELTPETFAAWQAKIREAHYRYLGMPERTPQPDPVMLSSVQRDGYRVEKWEFYPDDYTVVPFLALIPDGASAEHPVPGVICLPGTDHSKEFLAGEETIDHPHRGVGRYPERNRMALHLVRAGMAAFAFDNPCFGECSVLTDPEDGHTEFHTTGQFAAVAHSVGMNYLGVSTFQKLCFMDHLRALDYVDRDRLAVSAHSLGTGAAIALALFCDDIRAVVFNDFLEDELGRALALTEQPQDFVYMLGSMHLVPGLLASHNFPEVCAALAPRWMCINEGGAEERLDIVRRAYAAVGAEDRLDIHYYPRYSDPASRVDRGEIPKFGLSMEEYYADYCHIDPPDHSFRVEHALSLLKKCFGMA